MVPGAWTTALVHVVSAQGQGDRNHAAPHPSSPALIHLGRKGFMSSKTAQQNPESNLP